MHQETAVLLGVRRGRISRGTSAMTRILMLPPFLLLSSMLISAIDGATERSDGNGWHFSAERMEAGTRLVRKEILPNAPSARVFVEPVRGFLPNGECRQYWNADILEDGKLRARLLWDDATGELIQISRKASQHTQEEAVDTAIASTTEALHAARVWLGRVWPTSDMQWRPVEKPWRREAHWRVCLQSQEGGRIYLTVDAITGELTYLSYRRPGMRERGV